MVVPANDDDDGTATVAQPLYCVVSAFRGALVPSPAQARQESPYITPALEAGLLAFSHLTEPPSPF